MNDDWMNNGGVNPEDEPLLENIKKIVGGVTTIVALLVPVILIRKLTKRIEQSDGYKSIEKALS